MLIDLLTSIFILSCSTYWKSEEDINVPGLGGEGDTYPYVSFTINISWDDQFKLIPWSTKFQSFWAITCVNWETWFLLYINHQILYPCIHYFSWEAIDFFCSLSVYGLCYPGCNLCSFMLHDKFKLSSWYTLLLSTVCVVWNRVIDFCIIWMILFLVFHHINVVNFVLLLVWFIHFSRWAREGIVGPWSLGDSSALKAQA